MTASGRQPQMETPTQDLDEVTVVIPTKDRPRLAYNAAAMALAQVGVTPRVIVVDNGSSPDHADSLRRFLDPRARLITVPARIGVSEARNIGLREATTRWIAFLDDDDYWTPHKLATQMRALLAEPARLWVISGAVAVTEDGKFVGLSLPASIADYYREILVHPPPAAMSDLIVDRATALAVGGFRTDLDHWEDWDFAIRYAERAAEPVAVYETLGVYWVRKSGASSDIAALSKSLDVFVDLHAARRDAMKVAFDRIGIDYYLAYRATRFPDSSSFAPSVYRSLLRRTHRPQFALYGALSRFTPRAFSRITEWDRLRRLSRKQRREIARLVEEARSSRFASLRG
jgi:glycosyltransferase involved in cell wall biosynthesis